MTILPSAQDGYAISSDILRCRPDLSARSPLARLGREIYTFWVVKLLYLFPSLLTSCYLSFNCLPSNDLTLTRRLTPSPACVVRLPIKATNMPLPADEQIVATSETLVKTLRGAFDTPESHRPGSSFSDPFSFDYKLTNPSHLSPRQRPPPPRHIHPDSPSLNPLQRTALHSSFDPRTIPLLLFNRPA
jgi:hypothetical protein